MQWRAGRRRCKWIHNDASIQITDNLIVAFAQSWMIYGEFNYRRALNVEAQLRTSRRAAAAPRTLAAISSQVRGCSSVLCYIPFPPIADTRGMTGELWTLARRHSNPRII